MAELTEWLAARIVEHVRGQALEPGTHITEQSLADHFRVSRTPVRRALAALAETGAVAQEPNRGFFVAQPAGALAAAKVAPTVEDEERLYYRIAEDRLNGRIAQRVTEADLVRRYKVSRKRVAATLARMAREGWLERLAGHGMRAAGQEFGVRA